MMRSKKQSKIKGILFALLLVVMNPAYAESGAGEYAVKAALLFKLNKFVTWPIQTNSPLVVCVYGKNPFGQALKKLGKKSFKGGPPTVLYLPKINSDLERCNILFIAQSAASHLRRVLLAVSHSSILTISDISQFADSGGMVELSTQGQRIRFRINLQAAKEAHLKLASPLLELSTIVSGRN